MEQSLGVRVPSLVVCLQRRLRFGPNGYGTANFGTPYSASPGLYFIGILYNTSDGSPTNPQIGGYNMLNSALAAVDFTNTTRFAATLNSQTALPSSQAMSGCGATASHLWLALY